MGDPETIAPQLPPLAWGTWPFTTPEIDAAVRRVLHSGRWAISGMKGQAPSEEKRFAAEFADYLGVGAVAPTANGSSALVAALSACGVSYGDEVLVPGLAWVACASAVVRVGAVPVFVDIDPETFAMDPRAAAALIGPRVTAVLVTHLSSSIADLDEFEQLCERHGIVMIEDCSQAHGAVWRGRRVGAHGRAAAFSFQSSKLLTSGEGGAAVTRDPSLSDGLQQLRADGRVWSDEGVDEGFPDLVPGRGWQGHNHCLTEIQAAILRVALPMLDAQNEVRVQRVEHLESALDEVEGVRTVRRRDDPRVDRETFWHLPIQIDADAFGGASAEVVRSELSRLVGLFLEPVGAPMPQHRLYRPGLYRRFPAEHVERLVQPAGDLRGAEHLAATCFTLPHHALLVDPSVLDRFVERLSLLQTALRR
ncbi:aminotransferase [Gordonia araii NBRC 100433]|uniref:Aminotransferase n=1 Tax=Gordonia araii NBRC 100433 TaxID=1073574 RepID=G7GYC4_9ACTN|nr:DegT/DnrJ/EryC1/StrS family aminotransferase [Gordonia araii]NNG97403.1 DegT/DnrJ/EryC1/StrS family aminotransferase [Gordonia araii NBRC 100433]GAB08599.1 aminotransferase [Gordonia araii NBRC 100433]